MKCDQCEQEATVHEVTIKSGKKVEKHLCEACAKKQGISVQSSVAIPLQEMLNKYMIAQATQTPSKASSCPTCGLAYTEFRQHGLLGCPECYKAFEGLVGPLLERAHEGATHHVGKAPRRASRGGQAGAESVIGGPRERAERLGILQKQLEQAVRAEQYEKAAKLRDEIQRETAASPPATPKARRRKEPDA